MKKVAGVEMSARKERAMTWFLVLALLSLTACARSAERVDATTTLQALSFGTPAFDAVWGLASYPAGVYVVGITDGDLHARQKGGGDAFIRKVDASSRVLWAEQFGTAEADNAWGAATDLGGNVYLVGGTEGSLAGPSHGGSDIFVRKYSADGQVLWTRQFGTEQDEYAGPVALSGDALYLAGHRISEGGVPKALVMKLFASGEQAWLEVSGTQDWSYATGVATDGEGNAYVAGMTSDSFTTTSVTTSDMSLSKVTPAGAVLWTKELDYGPREMPFGVAVEGERVYLAGYHTHQNDPDNRDARIVKFSTDGVKLWEERFELGGNDYVYSLSAFRGGVVFAGETVTPTGDSDGYVVKLNPADGRKLWQTKLATPKLDAAVDVLITSAGVYVAGESGGTPDTPEATDAFLVRLHGDTGEPLWADP